MGIMSKVVSAVSGLFRDKDAEIRRSRAREYAASDRYKQIKARYDAAQTALSDGDYWKGVDALSSRQENSAAVRQRLRQKSRYLVANNCHARGITLAVANDMIGTGARLQVLYDDESLCDAIESAWNEWANAVQLGQKLHTFHLASEVDGEAFLLFNTNPAIESSVQLDIHLKDAEMVTTPFNLTPVSASYVDGIEYDQYGNVLYYHLLRQHPGDFNSVYAMASMDADRVPERKMLHWFRHDRMMQCRGIPTLTPALSILAQLGRYSAAVLSAAEIAADFAAFIYTDQRPEDLTPDEAAEIAVKPWTTTPVSRGTIQALPDQWRVEQLNPTQPTTGYGEYTKALLREACHALLIPYNIANADFEGDSYAGGRMSLQVYQRQIKVRRSHFRSRVLDRIFKAWLTEAVMIPKLLPSGVPDNINAIPHAWYFDGWGHVDPTKEATAVTTRLSNFTTTLAQECAENGVDWRKIIRQRATEMNMQRDLGVLILPPGTTDPALPPDPVPDANQSDIADEVTDA